MVLRTFLSLSHMCSCLTMVRPCFFFISPNNSPVVMGVKGKGGTADPDPPPEKQTFGGLGYLSRWRRGQVECERVYVFSFVWHPETCLPRPIFGRPVLKMGLTHSDSASHRPGRGPANNQTLKSSWQTAARTRRHKASKENDVVGHLEM